MADISQRDQDRVTTLLAVRSDTFLSTVTLTADPSTHALLVSGSFTPSGTQDVNLTKVGGAAIALGQNTMTNSLPIAIASNQTWVGTTNLGKAEDAPSVSGDTGVLALAVRNDAQVDFTSTDGDYSAAAVDQRGNQMVVGNIDDGASDAGRPVKAGGVYKSTKPTLTDNLRGSLQLGTRGSLAVSLFDTDGTTGVNTLKSDGTATGQNSLQVANSYLSVAFTTSTVQAVGTTDVGDYRSVSVQITTQGGSSTVAFQTSNDNSNWLNTALMQTTGTSQAPVTTTGSVAQFYGVLTGRYFRLSVTGIASGSTAGTIVFSTLPTAPMTMAVTATESGTWNVGSSSATGSAVPSNAFYQGISDGTNLRGILGAANSLNSTGAGIPTAQIVGQFDDVSPSAVSENQFANLRMNSARQLYAQAVNIDTFGTATAFTITLASLANSTAGVGRQSTLITANTARSALITVKFTTGTSPTANTLIYVYLIRGDGTINDDNAGSSDAGITIINAPLLGTILCSAVTSNATYYGVFDTKFLGSLASTFGIAIVNSTGATANVTGGNFAAQYTLIT